MEVHALPKFNALQSQRMYKERWRIQNIKCNLNLSCVTWILDSHSEHVNLIRMYRGDLILNNLQNKFLVYSYKCTYVNSYRCTLCHVWKRFLNPNFLKFINHWCVQSYSKISVDIHMTFKSFDMFFNSNFIICNMYSVRSTELCNCWIKI